jgi:hypothetical protein
MLTGPTFNKMFHVEHPGSDDRGSDLTGEWGRSVNDAMVGRLAGIGDDVQGSDRRFW